MKTRLILTTVFAIILFAVAGNAQTLVRFNSHSIDVPLSTSRAGAPIFDALAGQPIKVAIHFAKMSKASPKLFLAAVSGKTFKAIPCGPNEAVATGGSTARMEVYLQIELQNALVSGYSVSGRPGSCGLLSIRLADGTEHFGKLRFVRGR